MDYEKNAHYWVKVRKDGNWEIARFHSKMAWFVIGAVQPFTAVFEVGAKIDRPANEVKP